MVVGWTSASQVVFSERRWSKCVVVPTRGGCSKTADGLSVALRVNATPLGSHKPYVEVGLVLARPPLLTRPVDFNAWPSNDGNE